VIQTRREHLDGSSSTHRAALWERDFFRGPDVRVFPSKSRKVSRAWSVKEKADFSPYFPGLHYDRRKTGQLSKQILERVSEHFESDL